MALKSIALIAAAAAAIILLRDLPWPSDVIWKRVWRSWQRAWKATNRPKRDQSDEGR
jgi:hypothetical protein